MLNSPKSRPYILKLALNIIRQWKINLNLSFNVFNLGLNILKQSSITLNLGFNILNLGLNNL